MSMGIIYFITGIFAVLFVLMYYSSLKPALQGAPVKHKKSAANAALAALLIGALIVRIIIATSIDGHRTDMNCFRSWGQMAYQDGLMNFYFSDSFTDYPPAYMYVLWFTGWLRSVFNWANTDAIYVLIIKLPAILCDVATGYMIYRLAVKRSYRDGRVQDGRDHAIGICVALLFLFNPAILLNSSAWGQVDSVSTLLLLASIYLLTEKKFVLACVAFLLGALTKPQVAIFAPVIAFAAVKMVMDDKSSRKKDAVYKIITAAVSCVVITFFIMLPFAQNFNFKPIIDQYINTVNSYPYGSVNAYNLFWLFRGGWEHPSFVTGATGNIGNPFLFMTFGIWSNIFIILVMAAAVWFFVRYLKSGAGSTQALSRSKHGAVSGNDTPNLYLWAAFIILGIFALAGRMHERYAYPAIALLACAFLYKRDVRLMWAYLFVSVTQFLNSGLVLYEDLVQKANVVPADAFGVIVALANIAIFIWMYRICKAGGEGRETDNHTAKSPDGKTGLAYLASALGRHNGRMPEMRGPARRFKMVRADYLIMAAVTLVYSGIALFNLGDMYAPESYWESMDRGGGFTAEFRSNVRISKIIWFTGCYEERKVDLSITEWADERAEAGQVKEENVNLGSVFAWHEYDVNALVSAVSVVTTQEKTRINELAFITYDGRRVTPVSITPIGGAGNLEALTDEGEMVPERISYKNSTHFDEIYHARTAYEFIEGLYPYENTHPPLGKIIISWGIMLFGMNPFGWRIMGTLFGILMLPFIYIFAKRLFGSTKIAALAIGLFAADFMHFVQTRISTIDVYVTFFIILMYYFMYRYYTMNFYRDKLWKTLVPLGLSGIFMGFGIASKWTGVYAAAGLAILFFITMGRRWAEYRRVKKDAVADGEQRMLVRPCIRYSAITLAFCLIFFIVIPAATYYASYIPFNRGWVNEEVRLLEETPSDRPGYEYLEGKSRTLWKDNEYQEAILDEATKAKLPFTDMRILLHNQESMFSYHSKLKEGHSFSSQWWSWPLDLRPVWYYSGETALAQSMTIATFGNPFIWWAGLLALFATAWIGLRRRDRTALLLIVGYFAQYLPWVLVSRATFIYHYFVCVPFLVLMICYVADYVLGYAYDTGGIQLRKANRNMWIYLGLCVLLFILFYPALSGMPASKMYIESLKWLGSWTF